MSAAVAGVPPVDVTNTPAIQRAKAILAQDRGLSSDEERQARADMGGTGQGSIESMILTAVYKKIAEIGTAKTQAAHAERMAAEVDKQTAHKLRRPERWAALTPLQRALHLVADKNVNEMRRALLALVPLLGVDTSAKEPANTFEPETLW